MNFFSATQPAEQSRGASGGLLGAPGTTWVIDHAAERLTQILNQPAPMPNLGRRKSDKENAA